MKPILILVSAAALLFAPSAVRADEVSKNAKVQELLVLTRVERTSRQMLEQMKSMLTAQLSTLQISSEARQIAQEMQQKMMTLIAERMSWDKAKPAYVRIYSETFTESELDGMLTFYKSPAGQSMVEKMPQLIQKSMAFGQEMMADVMPEIERMVTELRQRAEKK